MILNNLLRRLLLDLMGCIQIHVLSERVAMLQYMYIYISDNHFQFMIKLMNNNNINIWYSYLY